jgi:hypothetical protein
LVHTKLTGRDLAQLLASAWVGKDPFRELAFQCFHSSFLILMVTGRWCQNFSAFAISKGPFAPSAQRHMALAAARNNS